MVVFPHPERTINKSVLINISGLDVEIVQYVQSTVLFVITNCEGPDMYIPPRPC